MSLQPHQLKASKQMQTILKKHGLVLLSGEPRSGKTRSFLQVAKQYKNVLIVTQKNALPDVIHQCSLMKIQATVTNYHGVVKLPKGQKYDLLVIDEAHRWVGGYPKFSMIWRVLKKLSQNCDMIFSSGTLTPETYANLYPMLALSSESPWKKYATFNKWFDKYGHLYTIPINGFDVKKYDRMKTKKIFKDIKHLIVTITREDAGHKHEPVDKLHHIKLPKEQLKFQKKMLKKRFVENEKGLFMGDTPASLGQKLHQVGGGFVKGEEDALHIFQKNPKVDYIKKNFDPETTMVLAYYKAEQDCIANIFPHTGSTTKNAEGVDYSGFKSLVIYSHNHASSTYQQVRVRQANINREDEIIVHFLIAGEYDQKVYDIATGKEPYTRRWYE